MTQFRKVMRAAARCLMGADAAVSLAFLARRFALIIIASLCAVAGARGQEKEFSVVTLGTGAPPPLIERFGPAILVTAGDQKLLFDAGRGVTQRLWQIRTPIGKINAYFLTHLHSDHVVGLPDLWLTGWLDGPFGQRKSAMKLYGPKGTLQLATGLRQAYAWDLEHREADQKLEPGGAQILATEFDEGVIYTEGGVTVSAFLVDHGEKLRPSFGYRIDFDGRSVVISGDTRFSENLIKHAANADLIIHAVAMIKDELLQKSEWYRDILAHHTPPKDVGVVFSRTKPKSAALIHFVLLGDLGVKAPTLDDVMNGVRETYQGPLVLTKDLMRFDIRRNEVMVVESSK